MPWDAQQGPPLNDDRKQLGEVVANATNSTCCQCNVDVTQCQQSTQDARKICGGNTAHSTSHQCTRLLTLHTPPGVLAWLHTLSPLSMQCHIEGQWSMSSSVARCNVNAATSADYCFYFCFIAILLLGRQQYLFWLETDIWCNNCPLCQNKLVDCCSFTKT